MSSEITRLAAVSSVNCGLNVQPTALKKTIDLFRFFTGTLTKILVLMSAPVVKEKLPEVTREHINPPFSASLAASLPNSLCVSVSRPTTDARTDLQACRSDRPRTCLRQA